MNFQFSKIAIDLAGNPLKDRDNVTDLSLGRMLAGIMVSQSKGDAIKFYDWAKKMYAGEVVNLDRSDVKIIREFVETNDQLTVLAKAQLFEILDSGRE
jgi:hypothetical protein